MEGRSATVDFEVPGKLTLTAVVIGRSPAECEHLQKFVDQVKAGQMSNGDASIEFKDGALHLLFTTESRDHFDHVEAQKVVEIPKVEPMPNAPIAPEDQQKADQAAFLAAHPEVPVVDVLPVDEPLSDEEKAAAEKMGGPSPELPPAA